MSILQLRDIQLSFGGHPLLHGLTFHLERDERVCLLGRNGEGKSTLLKVIAGELTPDAGERTLSRGLKVARQAQEAPPGLDGSVFDIVAEGLAQFSRLLRDYHAATLAVASTPDEAAMSQLARAQQALEEAGGWQVEQRVETVLSRMALDPDSRFSALSGGLQRRVLLARTLVDEPDVLLLDEPTNHLDITSIEWLEGFLADWRGALVFITHDRGFLRRLATRIVELDRGGLAEFPGDYDNYLRRRSELDHAEAVASARFDKRLAQEEVWIRQGIKARRTRNEGRVRRLQEMREQYRARRSRQGTARLQIDQGEGSGKLVCELTDVSFRRGERPIVAGLTTTLMRGDRVGIVGPNGCGKSTLLRLLLGELQPDAGRVRRGTQLEIAYFDQMRAQLDEHRTVQDSVAEGSDKVEVQGKSRHVISYLQDFLFTPDRCRQPVAALSGGERNRLLLARLFTRPANLLVLDEPTNDLDLETLDLLEELLLDYRGTLLLVSHDRDFLDHVVTSTLVFEGEGRVNAYVGGYADWLRQRPEAPAPGRPASAPKVTMATVATASGQPAKPAARPAKAKLGYKEQRELEALPAEIEQLEQTIETLQGRLASPELYREGGDQIGELKAELAAVEARLEQRFDRWSELEAKA